MKITAAHVRQARRELARDSLYDFCGMIEIPGAPVEEQEDDEGGIRRPQAAHHRLLIDKLEAVERGEIRRLMVFMPPGSAKSTYASVIFPVWFMGREKRRNVIVATYASELGRKIGRRARSIVRQSVYSDIFKTELSKETSAADEWALTNENELMTGGILSGITGNRADLIIIDDPIKGRQQADSEVIRASTKSEYDDSIKTRLKPGGRIVLIQTRWHEADLAGSILPEGYDGESGPVLCQDGETWEVLSIPAKAISNNDPLGRTAGEYLWPEWFDARHWAAFENNPRTWGALYQQSPTPDTGSFFRREWFARSAPPVGIPLHKYLTSDHAPGGSETSDWQTLRMWGIDANRNVYHLEGYRGQVTMDVLALKAADLIRRHKPFAWFPEDDNNWKASAPFIVAMLREKGVGVRIEPISPHGSDKPTKALPAQAMASMGRIFIPATPEGDMMVDQYVKFPAGKNDDEVDALATLCRALDMAHPAIVKVKPGASDSPTDRYAKARAAAVSGDAGMYG